MQLVPLAGDGRLNRSHYIKCLSIYAFKVYNNNKKIFPFLTIFWGRVYSNLLREILTVSMFTRA